MRGHPWIALALIVLADGAPSAQGSPHERVGVERAARDCIEAGVGLSWLADGSDCSLSLDPTIEYSRDRSLSLSLDLPMELAFDGSGPRPKWNGAIGDAGAAVAYLWRREGYRAQAGLRYGYAFERREGGAHSLAPSVGFALVRDPVVLSLTADLSACLPREEGGYLVWPAVSGGIGISLWELLNDRIGLRFRASPGFTFRNLRVGFPGAPIPSWRLGLGLALSWDERSWGLEAGWSGDARSGSGAFDARTRVRGEW
jgi:hypothetical protein